MLSLNNCALHLITPFFRKKQIVSMILGSYHRNIDDMQIKQCIRCSSIFFSTFDIIKYLVFFLIWNFVFDGCDYWQILCRDAPHQFQSNIESSNSISTICWSNLFFQLNRSLSSSTDGDFFLLKGVWAHPVRWQHEQTVIFN